MLACADSDKHANHDRTPAGTPLPFERHQLNQGQRFVADPIHKSVELNELCVALMDTPAFQRLRDLRQLGLTWMVYPSGCHNRCGTRRPRRGRHMPHAGSRV